jgi:hypothetical protein
MKKVLSLSLILALGLAGFAQVRDMKVSQKAQMRPKVAVGNEKATEDNTFQNVEKAGKAMPSKSYRYEDFVEYETMINSYDDQSNANIANRIAAWEDGSMAIVATFVPGDKNPWTQSNNYRGTGYNYFDGSDFGEQPERRIENQKTGWPSIAPLGENGEIFVCHTGSGLIYYTRANKGEGNWVGPNEIPNPEGHASVTTEPYALSWPRIVTSGPNHSIINIVALDQSSDASGDNGEVTAFLVRSTDGGANWTTTRMPGIPNEGVNQYYADDYSMASHGNTVAALFVAATSRDVLLVKSNDNGETWTSTVVWKDPFNGEDWTDPFVFDTMSHDMLYIPSMGSLALDNDGMAHVVLTSQAVICAEEEGYYSYWYGLGVDGLYYWKEGDETITRGPIFEEDGFYDTLKGLCPYDTHIIGQDTLEAINDIFVAAIPYIYYGENQEYPDYVFDRISYVRFLDAHPDLPDDAPIGYVTYFPQEPSNSYYKTDKRGVNGNYHKAIGAALCGWPSIAVDDNGIVAIAYSVPDWRRDLDGANGWAYRCVYVSYIDHGVIYPHADYLAEDFSHQYDEMVSVTALPYSYGNRQFVFSYMCDTEIGWANQSNSTDDPSQHNPHENTVFVSIITPDEIIDNVKEAVNPMNSVSVRPNPATDALYIDINAKQSSNMTAVVYNITGQKVMEQNMSLTTGANTRSINVSNLTSGIYFVTFKSNGFEETMKFVVK